MATVVATAAVDDWNRFACRNQDGGGENKLDHPWKKFFENDLVSPNGDKNGESAPLTLSSLLVYGDLDFVIHKDGTKFPVESLERKYVLVYYCDLWFARCRSFKQKLEEAYNTIKENGDTIEVIFITISNEKFSHDKLISEVPPSWLTLSFRDERELYVYCAFAEDNIPRVAAFGPTGKLIATDIVQLVEAYGANAYPFTEERMKEVDEIYEDMPKQFGWPAQCKHEFHKHELVLTRCHLFYCDKCQEEGVGWSYCCEECNFDLHPECAWNYKKPDWPKYLEKGNEDGYDKEHRLFLTETQLYTCFGCDGVGWRWKYHCASCPRDYHPRCALAKRKPEWPDKLKHAQHDADHELRLVHCNKYRCDLCEEYSGVWKYECETCLYALHPDCALFGMRPQDPAEGSVCDEDCRDNA